MSAHNLPVILSPAAQEDYEDIRTYTVERWDDAQWVHYEAILVTALQRLGETPFVGCARGDLRPGARTLVAGQHVIVYEVTARAVRVARMMHASRNLRAALHEEL